jgi:hypothetical protein
MKPIESAIERMKFTFFAHSSTLEPTYKEIVQLMTDLRHLCDDLGLDYYSLADRSYDQYLVERDEATRPVDGY